MRYKKFFLFLILILVIGAPPLQGKTKGTRLIETDLFTRISEEIKPSVVNLTLTHAEELKKGRFRLLFEKLLGTKKTDEIEDFFTYILFHEFPERTYLEKLVGSGIVVREDGVILTNEHVVSKQGALEVVLADGRAFPARIIGKDYLTDLAVLKIDAEDLSVVRFGDSSALRVGEWVLSIGNSLGFEYTVSAGIVSAKGRYLLEDGVRPYSNMIQTDAPINLGNSGGPLVNMRGEVIGVSTSIIPGGQNLGFAIPINQAKEVLPDLIATGGVQRGWLGFTLRREKETEDLCIVDLVLPHSPAEKAGLHTGDKILTLNGAALGGPHDIHQVVRKKGIGSPVSLMVDRNGKTLVFEVPVELMPIPKFTAKKIYPSGLEGFILRLPTRTRWLLVISGLLFLILLIDVRIDMARKIGRVPHKREEERREEERRIVQIPFEEIRVAEERRQSERRHSERRHKKRWFKAS